MSKVETGAKFPLHGALWRLSGGGTRGGEGDKSALKSKSSGEEDASAMDDASAMEGKRDLLWRQKRPTMEDLLGVVGHRDAPGDGGSRDGKVWDACLDPFLDLVEAEARLHELGIELVNNSIG